MTVKLFTVNRLKGEADWTLSKFDFDGKEMGVGIEDEKRDVKVKGETRLDAGLYDLALRNSPHFSNSYYRDDDGNLIHAIDRRTPEQIAMYSTPHEMIWITGTPRHEFCLIHWGNTDDDTDGCYVVGCVFGTSGKQKAVLNSRKKYTEIYPIIWKSIKNGLTQIKFVDND